MRYKSPALPVRAAGPGGKILDRDGFAMLTRGVFLVLVVVAALSAGRAAPGAAPYVVNGVDVDVTAADAATARDQAILEGQRKAFVKLMEQQLGTEQAATIATPSDDRLSEMVQDFEVESERVSTVRYIGVLTYRFDAAAIDAILGRAPEPGIEVIGTGEPLPSGPVRTITVSVPIASLQDWLEVQRRLTGIRNLQRTEVRGIARTEGQLNLVFFGDEVGLQQALAQRQLALSQNAQQWVLRLGEYGGTVSGNP
jgi:hypothetical protein